MANLDKLAYNLATSVNTLHSAAYDKNGDPGQLFFADIGAEAGAAGRITLNPALTGHPELVAIAQEQTGAPGDNRVALAIAALEQQAGTVDGSFSISGYFESIVVDVAQTMKTASDNLAIETDIRDQLTNLRESVSGVSIDEEMINMITFQRAFEANARVISTVDEMMQTVLSLKQ